MAYLWLKAFHVVSIIAWMAGVLYFWRLLVYHASETEPVVIARLQVMEMRLRRYIMNPAAVASWGFGLAVIATMPGFLAQPWLHAKLSLVVALTAHHLYALHAERRLGADPRAYDHRFLRVMNEVPTLLMVGVVVLVIVKPFGG
jgi:putative membrane protein